ncbi:metallophosphoesterase [Halobacillus mangrovi]|uniref:metallophosphoesterase n=1 Tax=Halobacillus mangrovi TaxID=402384 RepID=UPI003D96357C
MKLTRRKFIKNSLRSVFGIIGLTGASYYYARYVEPRMIAIRNFTLESVKIPTSLHDVKVLQFSDTHVGYHYDLKQFKKLINEINNQKPDLILFTGDLVDAPHLYDFPDELPILLSQLSSPLGKFWIYGNHDHGGNGTEKIKEVMKAGGFKLLQNSHTRIGDNKGSFILAGLDDVMLGRPNIDEALHLVDPDIFTLLMVHEPDVADEIQHYPVDIQLSGHSHGGQVQLPIYGYMITPPYAEKYVEGSYQLGDRLQLFVSRGVGTTRMPYRFLCRPEISVYTLKSK